MSSKRPHEVPGKVYALLYRAVRRPEVGIQVRNPFLVFDIAFGICVIVDGAPVLGNVDGQVGVLFFYAYEYLGQPFRLYGPAHRGLLRIVRDDRSGVQFGEGCLGQFFVWGVADGVPKVVVDAEEVNVAGDNIHVTVLHRRKLDAAFAVVREQVLRILAAEHRIQVEPVRVSVHAPNGFHVSLAVSCRPRRLEHERNAELVLVAGAGDRAHALQGQAVTEKEVVRGGEGRGEVRVSGSVDAVAVAHPGGDPRFVQGDPKPNVVGERFVDDARILGKALAGLSARPSTPVFKHLRQDPNDRA